MSMKDWDGAFFQWSIARHVREKSAWESAGFSFSFHSRNASFDGSLNPKLIFRISLDMTKRQAMPPYCCNKDYSYRRSRLATHTLSRALVMWVLLHYVALSCCNYLVATCRMSFIRVYITILFIFCCNTHVTVTTCHIYHIYTFFSCNNYQTRLPLHVATLSAQLLQLAACHLSVYTFIFLFYFFKNVEPEGS